MMLLNVISIYQIERNQLDIEFAGFVSKYVPVVKNNINGIQ